MGLTRLVDWVREKKEFANLPENIIMRSLTKHLPSKIEEELKKEERSLKKSKPCIKAVKETRAELRTVYGVFWLNKTKREKVLAKGKELLETSEELLNLHPSTKERLPNYEEIYTKIFSEFKDINSILDLAAGLNPCSYPLLPNPVKYIANELSEVDTDFINDYFTKFELDGKAISFDLVEESDNLLTIKADVCFLLKALDGLEQIERNISRRLLEKIQSPYLVISFSTKTLGGKKDISKTKRYWLEKIFNENKWPYKTFEIPNEMFYLARKS